MDLSNVVSSESKFVSKRKVLGEILVIHIL